MHMSNGVITNTSECRKVIKDCAGLIRCLEQEDYSWNDKDLISYYLEKQFKGYRITFSYPFRKKRVKIQDLLQHVEDFFNHPKQTCIMRYHNFVEGDHWNVPRIITKNTHILKFWDRIETTFAVDELTLKPYKRDDLTHIAKDGVIYLTLTEK